MTQYSLKIHKHVKKFLLSLSPEWQNRFYGKLEMLRQNPRDSKQLDIKPMQGAGEHLYRLRIGQYRLIYQIVDQELVIFLMTAGSRGDVYK